MIDERRLLQKAIKMGDIVQVRIEQSNAGVRLADSLDSEEKRTTRTCGRLAFSDYNPIAARLIR